MKLRVLGRVDLATGRIYDNEGEEVTIPKPKPLNVEELQERLERRSAWLAGEFSFLP